MELSLLEQEVDRVSKLTRTKRKADLQLGCDNEEGGKFLD
jgi:hypothetical protein